MTNDIREPKQKRSIEKKEKIVDAGWKLITKNGYYNTNTAEIATEAGVSTGIVYQYFKDKHDILIEGLKKNSDKFFFPMLKNKDLKFDKNEFDKVLQDMVNHYIKNHKVSNTAHEEIMAMVHSDKKVAEFYYKRELELTNDIRNMLISNGFEDNYLYEKSHIIIGLIDNLCHEVIYHKHSDMNYEIMSKIIIETINNILNKKSLS